MSETRTPFLQGALDWIYDGDPPEACPQCGYRWDTSYADACELIRSSPDRFEAALDGGDGMVPQEDGSWNATAYVWHLTDLARSWAERWRQIEADPGSRLVGWDPDQLAEVRGYRSLPTTPGLWALRRAVDDLMASTDAVGRSAQFIHGDWSDGDVGDAMVWLGHEFRHHEQDVRQRAV